MTVIDKIKLGIISGISIASLTVVLNPEQSPSNQSTAWATLTLMAGYLAPSPLEK